MQHQLGPPERGRGLDYLPVDENAQAGLAALLLELWPLRQLRIPKQRKIVAVVKQIVQPKVLDRRRVGQRMDHKEVRQRRADADETYTLHERERVTQTTLGAADQCKHRIPGESLTLDDQVDER